MTKIKKLLGKWVLILGVLVLVIGGMDIAVQGGESDSEYDESDNNDDGNEDGNDTDSAGQLDLDDDVPFAIRIVIPENQIDDTDNFFNLETEPSEEQTLMVEMFNSGSYPIQVSIDVSTAFTNDRINVDYSGTQTQPDDTLLHLMEDIVEVERPMVEMEPFSIITFYFNVNMPDEPFDGVLAGGLNFQMLELEAPTSSNDDENGHEDGGNAGLDLSDPAVRNLYAYTVAVLLHQGTPAYPELILRSKEITPVGPQIEIRSNIQNTEAAFAENVVIRSLIIDSHTSEIVHDSTTEGDLKVAPNSNFNYAIFVEAGNFTTREYIVNHHIDSDNGAWEFSERITLIEGGEDEYESEEVEPDEEADEDVDEDVEPEVEAEPEPEVVGNGFPWLVLLIVFAVLLILIPLILLIYLKRKSIKDAQLEAIQRQLIIKLMEESFESMSGDSDDSSQKIL